MPRPHLPTHLSLTRVKSASSYLSQQPSAPSTPPAHSRNSSPNRQIGQNMSSNGTPAKSPTEQRGDHKGMGLVLRVNVLKGRNLAAKDKSGTSDPYLVLTLGETKQATSVVSKTLSPEWNQTFEFPVTEADSALLEVVCWDKDRFKKDYMGEFDIMLDEIFASGNTMPEPKWFRLEGRRSGRRKKKDSNVSGEVLLKFTLYDPLNTAATAQHVIQKFHGVVGQVGLDEEDEDEEALLSKVNSRDLEDLSEEEDGDKEPSDETDDGVRTPGGSIPDDKQKRRRRQKIRRLKQKSKLKAYEFSGSSDVAGVLYLEINRITDLPPEKNVTRTGFDMDPFVVTSLGKKTYRTRTVNHNLNPVYDEKLVFQVSKHELNYSLSFAVVDKDKFSGNDFVGTALFPVEKVRSLAPEADPETGLYKLPDPDAITDADTRRRKWRVPMSRSTSQNNLGKLSRNSSQTNLSKLTKTTSNSSLNSMGKLQRQDSDPVEHSRPAPTSMPSTSQLSTSAPGSGFSFAPSNEPVHADGSDETGLYYYELPLELRHKSRWEDKHNPVLYIRAKYLPYQALRQQFWRVMLRQYDADESGKIDKIELVTMLDTLGSTLHNRTIDGFFQRFKDENGGEEILTMNQAVICLEDQLVKSQDTHKHMHSPHWTAKADPRTSTAGLGIANNSSSEESPGGTTPYFNATDPLANFQLSTAQIPTLEVSDLSEAGERGDRLPEDDLSTAADEDPYGPDMNEDPEAKEEHVVEIHECPICHLPRLTRGRKTTDADIITHIATCASSDWRAVNNLVMAGFVTSSQAQRKWYSKVITKVSYGGYRLGANSANILVQDRITGMINEERMSVYVRLGIRLLYKGLKSRIHKDSVDSEPRPRVLYSGLRPLPPDPLWIYLVYVYYLCCLICIIVAEIFHLRKHVRYGLIRFNAARKLLRKMSFNQGKKYDDPASAASIPGFINFHQLDMGEVLLKTEQFRTFNEFFYRELKPGARPCSAPDDPNIIVSPADCRSVVFNRLEDAQRIWVKGREFSVERLLGDAYPQDAKRYKNGALGIMRLAPQDYHRFHIPVDGIMGQPKLIEGEYYTVNPMAIRSALDVYGENVRVCVPIDSECHGRVMVVCVGAMMVGSTVITRKKGDKVRRAEELGYFKFGGSTLLLLFEPNVMRFDDDLVANSNVALETLVRVGMSVGHTINHEPWTPDMKKDNPTEEEKQDARRRIEGSLAPSTGGMDPNLEAAS